MGVCFCFTNQCSDRAGVLAVRLELFLIFAILLDGALAVTCSVFGGIIVSAILFGFVLLYVLDFVGAWMRNKTMLLVFCVLDGLANIALGIFIVYCASYFAMLYKRQDPCGADETPDSCPGFTITVIFSMSFNAIVFLLAAISFIGTCFVLRKLFSVPPQQGQWVGMQAIQVQDGAAPVAVAQPAAPYAQPGVPAYAQQAVPAYAQQATPVYVQQGMPTYVQAPLQAPAPADAAAGGGATFFMPVAQPAVPPVVMQQPLLATPQWQPQ
eukprot:TRINITY_DN3728_c0_g1_i1.p2 TRINITY_DN3728_c0_g1~~TRINITY_DN3728_c0_g1_i1.p2  ORF type:complete len:268 (+),score=75.86 TRINITY_DN3728_c0_g1_i1:42-845(+)